MAHWGPLGIVLLMTVAGPLEAVETFVLTPEVVVKRSIEFSRRAAQVRLEAQASDAALLRIEGRGDFNLSGSASYVIDRSENLSGLSSLEDKQAIGSISVDKKFFSGTKLSTSYQRIIQRSDLTPTLQAFRSASQAYDFWQARIDQDLLQNFLGIADRYRLSSAELQKQRLRILENESLEAVALEGLNLFLSAYIAEQKVRETEKAYDKYRTLTSFLSDKVSRGLGDEAEVGKARAQLGASERAMKAADLDWRNKRAQLVNFLQYPLEQAVKLAIDKSLPAEPASLDVSVESLERVRAARLLLEAAEKDRDAAQWETMPDLKAYGAVGLSGLDQNAGESFSEMAGADKPRYEVGLQFRWSPLSSRQEADRVETKRLASLAEVEASRVLEAEKTFVDEARRNLEMSREISNSADKVHDQWESVLKNQERRFRRGIISLNEMIQDYSSLFQAESSKRVAEANYLFSFYQWKAVTSKLIQEGSLK